MRKILFTLLLYCICLLHSTEQIQIGEGNITNSHLPIFNRINYSYSQMIYPDYLLSEDYEIIGIAFNLNFDSDSPIQDAYNQFFQHQNDLIVKLGTTQHSSFNNIDWQQDSDLQECFSGTWSTDNYQFIDTTSGWLSISFDTPYIYQNGENLLISIKESRDGMMSSYERFLAHSYTDTMGLFTGSMTSPVSTDALNNYSALRETNLPNIKLLVNREMLTPEQPFPYNGSVDVPINTNLNWYWNAESYNVYLGTNESNLTLLSNNTAQQTLDIPFDLETGTHYFWRVEGTFSDEIRVGPTWSFTTSSGQNMVFQDDFEDYTSFQDLGQPWTCLDNDSSLTYGLGEWDFDGEGNAHGFVVWEPSQLIGFPFNAFTGEKCLVSLASVIPPNEDIIISPVISPITSGSLSFMTRSMTSQYGLERIKVYIYPDADIENPISLHETDYIEVTDNWTLYEFPIEPWSNQSFRIGIECCSFDALLLAVDNVVVTGLTAIDENVTSTQPLLLSVYPNPAYNNVLVEIDTKSSGYSTISLYDIKGRLLRRNSNVMISSGKQVLSLDKMFNVDDYSSGVYFIMLETGNVRTQKKFVFIK